MKSNLQHRWLLLTILYIYIYIKPFRIINVLKDPLYTYLYNYNNHQQTKKKNYKSMVAVSSHFQYSKLPLLQSKATCLLDDYIHYVLSISITQSTQRHTRNIISKILLPTDDAVATARYIDLVLELITLFSFCLSYLTTTIKKKNLKKSSFLMKIEKKSKFIFVVRHLLIVQSTTLTHTHTLREVNKVCINFLV